MIGTVCVTTVFDEQVQPILSTGDYGLRRASPADPRHEESANCSRPMLAVTQKLVAGNDGFRKDQREPGTGSPAYPCPRRR